MNSNRPDWGYAFFVTLARLIVIDHSIQTGQWTFLDDRDGKAATIPRKQLTLYEGQIQKQQQAKFTRFHKGLSEFINTSIAKEKNYAILEIAANRYHQWENAENKPEIRYHSEQPLPVKSISPDRYLITNLSEQQLTKALRFKEMAVQRLFAQEADRHAYHLVTNNCVTALFESLDASMPGQSEQLLGGYIDPKTTFVPFQAFDSVLETYHVVNIKDLLAYRQQKLANLYQRKVDSVVYARESNVFSSSLYNHNPDDAWFVFFTDDTVLLRPLFGVVNTLAATSQSLFGLLRWPFDGGKELKTGARGVITSLPELAFFNIRKGSYPYPVVP